MKRVSSSFIMLVVFSIGFAFSVSVEGASLVKQQDIVTGTSSIEIGSGIDEHHRIVYTAVERSDIYDNGEKIVKDSWIEAVGLPVSASVPYGVAKILKRGDLVPGHRETIIGGIWNVSALCGKKDDVGHCLVPVLVFGAWTQDAVGAGVAGLYLFDPDAWDMRLIVRTGEEFPGAGIIGQRDSVWDVYNPRTVNLEQSIVSDGVQTGIDSQTFVVADGKCGPTAEKVVPCLIAYIEYEHHAKQALYLIAKEGMEELKGGTLSRLWNTAFFRPGVTEGSRFATPGLFSEAGVIFTVVRSDGDKKETEHRYVAVLTEHVGVAERAEVCVGNIDNASPYDCP